jgi:hypothetical protein
MALLKEIMEILVVVMMGVAGTIAESKFRQKVNVLKDSTAQHGAMMERKNSGFS